MLIPVKVIRLSGRTYPEMACQNYDDLSIVSPFNSDLFFSIVRVKSTLNSGLYSLMSPQIYHVGKSTNHLASQGIHIHNIFKEYKSGISYQRILIVQ